MSEQNQENHPNFQKAAAFGLHFPELMLPRPDIDLKKWCVVACDQFTSEPEYWQEVETLVADAPSTLRLVLPEVYLENPDRQPLSERIEAIRRAMNAYEQEDLLRKLPPGLMVIRRLTARGLVRTGVVAAIDLDTYEFTPGNRALTRASEATVPERIPPRLKIRSQAPLECAHVLLLMDDPEETCIRRLAERVFAPDSTYVTEYDVELQTGGGRLTGKFVPAGDPAITELLEHMGELALYREHHMMFAVGDGNHSLATAKAQWERLKEEDPHLPADHPARFAMVEIEALNDPGLIFEPIHQIIFGTTPEAVAAAARQTYGDRLSIQVISEAATAAEVDRLPNPEPNTVALPVRSGRTLYLWKVADEQRLPIEVLRDFLDPFVQEQGLQTDYIHGADVLTRLASAPDAVGFYLPKLNPEDFFAQIIQNGILPRKAFSLGDAIDKRFYMECRKIQ
jgi:hypothetical protein